MLVEAVCSEVPAEDNEGAKGSGTGTLGSSVRCGFAAVLLLWSLTMSSECWAAVTSKEQHALQSRRKEMGKNPREQREQTKGRQRWPLSALVTGTTVRFW